MANASISAPLTATVELATAPVLPDNLAVTPSVSIPPLTPQTADPVAMPVPLVIIAAMANALISAPLIATVGLAIELVLPDNLAATPPVSIPPLIPHIAVLVAINV
jgi:hypothetical protein